MSFSPISDDNSFSNIPEGVVNKHLEVKLSPSILKTTQKSSLIVKSILKKQQENTFTNKRVSFNPNVEVKEFSKYLTSTSFDNYDIEDHEGEEDDLDLETIKNTYKNELEGSKVQSHKDFFIKPYSNETRTFEQSENIYKNLQSVESNNEHTRKSASNITYPEETKEMQRSMFEKKVTSKSNNNEKLINPLFGRITSSLSNLGEKIRNLLSRITAAIKNCFMCIKDFFSKEQLSSSEPVLISVIYNPSISNLN